MNEHPPLDLASLPREARSDGLRADLAWSSAELKHLLATSGEEQREILEFRERYEQLPESTPLAPRSLKSIHQDQARYLKLQGRLHDLAERYKPFLGQSAADMEKQGIDPVLRERGILTSFAAALTVYDNYLSMRTILQDDRLRRLINHPMRGFGRPEGEIRALLDDLNSDERRDRMRAMVKGYEGIRQRLQDRDDPDIDFLQMAIESNAAFRFAQQATLGDKLPGTTRRWWERITDALDDLGKSTLGTVSELFGNGIGLVEFRKGKLYGDRAVEAHLYAELQPLDILLEKTPFRLTDKFIPGHFGHVAVWVGTAQELDALGLFEDPLFETAQCRHCPTEVRAGESVLEALRSGVQLSSLAAFLNVDDLAVLRPVGLTEADKRAALLRAFRQVGKQYDFNFEVQTVDKITCSELAYHVFPDIPWETEEQLGQYTISPDQVASQAFTDDAPLRFVDFYHDGARVDPAAARPRMEKLIEDEKA